MNEDTTPLLTEAPTATPQRGRFMEAVCFWERGRLLYGSAQLIVSIVLVIRHWPESRILFTTNLGSFFGAVIISNIFYTFAYLPELLLQIPVLKPLRKPVRWLLLIGGTIVACWLASAMLQWDLFRDKSND